MKTRSALGEEPTVSRVESGPPWGLAIFVWTGLIGVGCATGEVVPSMRYASTKYVQRFPVSADIVVSVPAFSVDGTARPESERLLLADSLRVSIEADLRRNGPFWWEPEHPRARLEVSLDASTKGDSTVWASVPPWIWGLFGLPTYSTEIVLTGSARVVLGTVTVVEVAARAECTSRTGLYYNWSVELGCAAVDLMEQVRSRIGEDAERIMAALAGKQPDDQQPAEPTTPAGTGLVVAVFDVEDASKRLDEETRSSLSEYVAARMTEAGGYRVVPRDQMRMRLQQEKVQGYKACFDESCQIELGKALAAQRSMSTKILRVGAQCTVSATVFDLKTETTERAATAKGPCDPEALMASIDTLVSRLVGDGRK